jgi:hypothetical protein
MNSRGIISRNSFRGTSTTNLIQITLSEKSIRIRTWWGVLITDYWTSLAYGVLPHTNKRFYDVPVPTLESLLPPYSNSTQRYDTTCFLHLCSITELLGDVLPLVYEVDPDREALLGAVQALKERLDALEKELLAWLPLPNKPGTSNLWLCILSTRLLLSRVNSSSTVYLPSLRDASSTVLEFILYLGEDQFKDF